MSDFTADTRPSWFPYEEKIRYVVFEPGVTSVGNYTFYDRKNLRTVTFAEGLTTIGHHAFYNCYTLKSIELPSTLTTFVSLKTGTYWRECDAFCNCIGLTSITIPENVINPGAGTFYGCSSLETVYWNAANAKVDGRNFGSYGAHILPYSTIIFGDCPVQTVVFGPKVETVPGLLFQDCGYLTTVKTSGSIKFVGYNAFKGTAWLRNQEPGMVFIDHCLYTYIPERSPQDPSAYEIVVPEGTTSITSEAFKDETYLVGITIPESLIYYEEDVFEGCTSLGSVRWNAVNSYIAHGLWNHVEKSDWGGQWSNDKGLFQDAVLYDLTFGANVQRIPMRLAYECESLKEVAIPASVKEIGGDAFAGCSRLTSLSIPDNVEKTGLRFINGCDRLELLSVGRGLKEYDNIGNPPLKKILWNACDAKEVDTRNGGFMLNTTVESVEFGDDVHIIPDRFLASQPNLTSAKLGKNVKVIGEKAFMNCSALTFELPDSLEEIKYNALSGTAFKTVLLNEKTVSFAQQDKMALDTAIVLSNDNSPCLTDIGYRMARNESSVIYAKYPESCPGRTAAATYIPVKSLATFADESARTVPYTGEPVDITSIEITSNIPGYDARVMPNTANVEPGRYMADVEFCGARKFIVHDYMPYIIGDSEEVIKIREDIADLAKEAVALLERIADLNEPNAESDWESVALTEDDMSTNARYNGNAGYEFKSWNVLFDNDPATFFHSDYSKQDSNDGLDHWLQASLNGTPAFSHLRINYTTRGDGSANTNAPRDFTVSGSENGVDWDELAHITQGAPSGVGQTYTSPVIAVADGSKLYRYVRMMVHSNYCNAAGGGHQYFVVSEFGIDVCAPLYTLRDPDSAVTEDMVNALTDAMAEAVRASRSANTDIEILKRCYDAFTDAYAILQAALEPSSITEVEADGENSQPLYDLSGRRVLTPRAGNIYIQANRKKII